MIIGTCIFASSMTGVYADTTVYDKPVSIQIEQFNASDTLMQKQNEIDQYVFEKNEKDFANKGIMVTNTGVTGDYVEVGITPFNAENDVTIQVTSHPPEIAEAQVVSAPAKKESSPIASFFSNIWEWIKNIF